MKTTSLGSMLSTTSQSSNDVESLREKSSRRFPSYRTIMITGIVVFIIAAAISVPIFLALSPSKSITGASSSMNATTSSNNASVTTAATIGGCFVAHSGTCCAGGSYCNMLHRTKYLFYFFYSPTSEIQLHRVSLAHSSQILCRPILLCYDLCSGLLLL